jgi:hypothetical protein
MARLGKAELAGKKDLAEELVPCPEWGGEVLVRELGGTARARLAAETAGLRAPEAADGDRKAETQDIRLVYDLMIKIVACSAINPESDKPDLFTEAELVERNGDVVQRLAETAMRLSKLTAADVKKEAVNLPEAQSGASTSV